MRGMRIVTYDETVEDLAAEYVDAMNGPPDGNGQHMTRYGQSHHMLHYMSKKFGTVLSTNAITAEFKARRDKINDQATTESA